MKPLEIYLFQIHAEPTARHYMSMCTFSSEKLNYAPLLLYSGEGVYIFIYELND